MSTLTPIWFPEPSSPDPTYAQRAEHTLDWLTRSTTARAKDCRRFLNEHIAKMPAQNRDLLVRDLREKWQSTFFELVVARLLQELGASLVLEEANVDGKRPDFSAQFSDETVTVEAKSPVFNGDSGEELKRRVPLLNHIESKIPQGWYVLVWEVPDIGEQESKRDFKRIVDRMLNVPPPLPDEGDKELVEECGKRLIHLHLYPAPIGADNSRLGLEAPIGLIDDSRDRIVYAVKRKRQQVRSSQYPVLLAIQASGISSDFEDFDVALFGISYERRDVNGKFVGIGFRPDGIFNNKSDKAPTYAGVLAFVNVGFNVCVGPVLYLHPRFAGTLPEALLQLEQRTYDAVSNSIKTKPSAVPHLTETLNLVVV